MARKVLLMMALVAALTLITGCGGGESVTAPPDVLPTTAAQIKSLLDERLPKARGGLHERRLLHGYGSRAGQVRYCG